MIQNETTRFKITLVVSLGRLPLISDSEPKECDSARVILDHVAEVVPTKLAEQHTIMFLTDIDVLLIFLCLQ